MLNKIISDLPDELLLILNIVNNDLDKIKDLLRQPLDWDKFLRLAEHHRVYPFIYSTLIQLTNMSVPGYVIEVLRQACQENTLNALRLTGEMVRLGDLLEKNNINAIVLKGAPLSFRLYGNIAVRPYVDIDILVEVGRLEQTLAILENEAYSKISEFDSLNLTPPQLQIYLKHHGHSSHIGYWNSKKRVLIEIHWKLSKYYNVLPFPNEKNIKKLVIAGSQQSVLSDDEWLLYLVLHGAGHKWQRLQWLLDIKTFIQQIKVDWVELNLRAKEFGIELFLHQALILINQLFRIHFPSDLESSIARDRTAWRLAYLALKNYSIDAVDTGGITGIYPFYVDFSYGFYMNRGLQKKFIYIMKLFEPSAADIKLVALPESLYALYYIIRPFNLIVQRLQRLIVK